MDKNYLPIKIGGRELGFRLRNKTIDILGDEIGEKDPLAYVPESMKWKDFKEYAITILYAGIVSDILYKKEQVDFTKDELKQWVEDCDPDVFYNVTNMYALFRSPKIIHVNGEVDKDTRSEAHNMVGTEANGVR